MKGPATAVERERKYELSETTGIPRLVGAGPVRGQAAPVEHVLDATYFDTPGYALARAGLTLRRRTGGEDAGWHLKLPIDADTREELHIPLAAEELKVPKALSRLVRAYTLGAKIGPVAHLRTDRFAHQLTDGDGHAVATLTDDHVTGEAAGDTARLERWREVEIELAPEVAPGVLDELERALTGAGAQVSPWPSKLRRLIGDRVPTGRKPPKRPDAGTVVVGYLREQADRLRQADVGVRRDFDDSVHQLRVCVRKLRSALRSFESIVDGDGTAGLVAELKWLGQRLGPARDLEVAEALVAAGVDRLPPELVVGPVRQQATRYFAREKAVARERVLDTLDGGRYLRLLRSLEAVLTEPPLTAAARKPARKRLRKPVRRAVRKMERAEKAARGLSGSDRERALHEVRKRAKRVRYALDVLRPVAEVGPWRKRVKAVLAELGQHQDVVVSREVLYRLGITGSGDGGNTFTFGLLYGQGSGETAERRGGFTRAWTGLRGKERPGWLS
ncbi:CYTH and CHAD domain-containing protein [Amycolatopsis sp. PS_44_ISF1]|uniref:CYTH and CHAD domain-containing protein n=1 Tax=Amycolatopsis sp. PS_44_ISF1 TaxID=2974917 RepID=UPI0028DE45F4|nr:CYTH and CHAD domain-containing protein [Amycolatopsis sp. PS_44_ISF1]MDT8913802.1 CYTH and CHAD domain-containing protein [Amycolatopsis sp. PS_44_ISF1]